MCFPALWSLLAGVQYSPTFLPQQLSSLPHMKSIPKSSGPSLGEVELGCHFQDLECSKTSEANDSSDMAEPLASRFADLFIFHFSTANRFRTPRSSLWVKALSAPWLAPRSIEQIFIMTCQPPMLFFWGRCQPQVGKPLASMEKSLRPLPRALAQAFNSPTRTSRSCRKARLARATRVGGDDQ